MTPVGNCKVLHANLTLSVQKLRMTLIYQHRTFQLNIFITDSYTNFVLLKFALRWWATWITLPPKVNQMWLYS